MYVYLPSINCQTVMFKYYFFFIELKVLQKVSFSKYNRCVALQYPFMNCVSLFITLFIFTHSLSQKKTQTNKLKKLKVTWLQD